MGREKQCIEQQGIKTISFDIKRGNVSVFQTIYNLIQRRKICSIVQPDLIHEIALQPIVLGFIDRLLGAREKNVCSFAGFGILMARFKERPWFLYLLKKIFPLIQKKGISIVQNKEDKQILSYAGVKESQIRLIPGAGVDIKKYQPADSSKSEKPYLTVLMACRLLWSKGINEFIQAAQVLQKDKALFLNFVLCGEPDKKSNDAIGEKKLIELTMMSKVKWIGFQENMTKIFNESDIFCLPTYYGEGIPKVLLEAMACGLPCITTNTPGCNNAVRNGINGVLIPPKNPKRLVDAILYLAKNPELRKKMGKKGRQRVLKYFSQEIIIKQTLCVYDELVRLKEKI